MTKPLIETHPELAAELVDQSLARKLTWGSSRKVMWRCPKGHEYDASTVTRTRSGANCPYCSNRRLLVGFNDLATTDPDLAAQLLHPEDGQTCTRGSKKKLEWKCNACGHVWVAASAHRIRGEGCPACACKVVVPGNNDLQTKYPEIAAELQDQSLATKLGYKSVTKVDWCCSVCGYEWASTVNNRVVRHQGCPRCRVAAGDSPHRLFAVGVNDLVTTHPELAKELVDIEDGRKVKAGSNKPLRWRCVHGHVYEMSPNDRLFGHGCAVCTGDQVMVGVNDLATIHPDMIAELVDPSVATTLTAGTSRKVEWRCFKGHTWFATVHNRTTLQQGCPECWSRAVSSRAEKDLLAFVQALYPGRVIKAPRGSVVNYELDVYVPDVKVAFEYNGLYWHREEHLGKDYHATKTKACADVGVRLFHIWEDDWLQRQDVVKQMIAYKLGLGATEGSVGARMCVAEVVNAKTAKQFLNAHHIQGYVSAKYHFGLRDQNGELCALLSVRDAKNHSRMHRHVGDWDVQRYATSCHVMGGFTKLLKFAERYIKDTGAELTRWVSFSSNDVSDGSMYKSCGFTCEQVLPPDYSYVGPYTKGQRRNKQAFQKAKFKSNSQLQFEEGMTERELAMLNGLYRVYDAGKKRWVKSV